VLRERTDKQFEGYYRSKATSIAGRIRLFRWIEIGLGPLGAVLGGLAAVLGASFAGWIAVFGHGRHGAVGARGGDPVRVPAHRVLPPAEELRQISTAAAEAGVTEEELRKLAVRAERVISVENQGWMSKLAEDPPAQKAPETGKA
jgi:hypothetical protein